MKIYSITKDEETLYWSEELGWVDEDNATSYTVLPSESMPIGWSGVES